MYGTKDFLNDDRCFEAVFLGKVEQVTKFPDLSIPADQLENP